MAEPGPSLEVALINDLARWDGHRNAVVVPAMLVRNRAQIACVLSPDVLSLLGIDPQDRAACLKSVAHHGNRLSAAAARRFARSGLDPGGELRVSPDDLVAVDGG